MKTPTTPRPYRQRARAEAARATHTRIMEALVALVMERGTTAVPLADVATQAGVTVPTVLRHFGSRDGLFHETFAYARDQILTEREAPVGDPAAAVDVVVDHYETRGRGMLTLLAHEAHDDGAARITAEGRAHHRTWVRTTFAPFLAHRPASDAEALTDLLVVATDLQTWALLRRDRGLSRDTTAARMLSLVRAVLHQEAPDGRGPDPDPGRQR
jgi:AcrR family transcriptional regulator